MNKQEIKELLGIALSFTCFFIFVLALNNQQSILSCVGLLGFFFGCALFVFPERPYRKRIQENKGQIYSWLLNYIEKNKTSINLFIRPALSKTKIILANKFVSIEFDIKKVIYNQGKIIVTDKVNNKKYSCRIPSLEWWLINDSTLFSSLFNMMTYEICSEDIIIFLKKFGIKQYKTEQLNKIFLDINQASEAELTALPGVTIAKAKRAVRMRKKYAFYLSVNQFYEAINLEEQFIKQIQSQGNKILLNKLPEYKKSEIKQEE